MKLEVMLSWVNVGDEARAKKFYGETLGLQKTFEMPGWAEFSHAQQSAAIGLAAPRPEGADQEKGATIVLKVDNIDAARKELSARGVKFEGETEEYPGVVRIATFRDPFGNRLQLAQPLVGQ